LPGRGNPHIVVRVEPVLKRYLEGKAAAKNTTTAILVREILAQWVREEVESTQRGQVESTLNHLDVLSKRLQLQILKLPSGPVKQPLQERKGPNVKVQDEREELYNTTIAMLKDAVKLSENEDLAKNAEARMTAMLVASNITRSV
jgi:hypothetical protein